MASYAFDPAWKREKERLEAQAAIYENGTRQLLENLGVTEGWHCAEIGGGTGTVARWLCERSGSSGHVVATDVDTRFLAALDMPNLEVRQHNIVQDPLEAGTYDLVHVRLVLMHLGDASIRALANMVEALKPGGWLLAEEFDCVTLSAVSPAPDSLEKANAAIPKLLQQVGANPYYGRELPTALEDAGLSEVQTDARTAAIATGTAPTAALALLLEQLRQPIVASKLLSEQEVDDALTEIHAPKSRWSFPPIMVAAWGSRPREQQAP